MYELVDEVSDPGFAAEALGVPVPACMILGRLREARRLAREYEEATQRLTAHHRVHGLSVPIEVEELAGGWEAVREAARRVEHAVAENWDTPCVRNPRSLLVCAIAHAYAGNQEEARRLEELADEHGMQCYATLLDPPRARLALVRGELGSVEQLLPKPTLRNMPWFDISAVATRFDGLVALGDRRQVEEEAPEFIGTGTYLEPFALRALGLVREDEALVAEAVARFQAFRVPWHVEQTMKLVAARS